MPDPRDPLDEADRLLADVASYGDPDNNSQTLLLATVIANVESARTQRRIADSLELIAEIMDNVAADAIEGVARYQDLTPNPGLEPFVPKHQRAND